MVVSCPRYGDGQNVLNASNMVKVETGICMLIFTIVELEE